MISFKNRKHIKDFMHYFNTLPASMSNLLCIREKFSWSNGCLTLSANLRFLPLTWSILNEFFNNFFAGILVKNDTVILIIKCAFTKFT